MQSVDSLRQLELAACALTIGAFDGVHIGHQHLLQRLTAAANKRGIPSVVLTFFPHPSVVLAGRLPTFYLTSPQEKAALLARHGVDHVITQPFDLQMSRISAATFLDRLRDQLGLKVLMVGPDFALGYQREGNVRFLERAAGDHGFEFEVVEPLAIDGEIVSSTRIRESLRSGAVARAARYLSRPFSLPGVVSRGAGRGKQLGVPTANLSVWEDRAYPRNGVYACWADWAAGRYPAVVNVGLRPTFEPDAERPTVEAHLLDFDQELYGEQMRLWFVERLRDEQKFDGPESLLAQIQADISAARKVLSTTELKPERLDLEQVDPAG